MTEEWTPTQPTRRTVLGTLAAMAGAAGLASADQALDVDADNLVSGNHRFTVTVNGVRASEIEEVTVTVGGVAFARVDVLASDPAVLSVNASNLVDDESIRKRDAVEVAIWLATGRGKFAGSDESQVVLD